MNRKGFLKAVFPLGLGLASNPHLVKSHHTNWENELLQPSPLKQNDLVAIVSVAGFIGREEVMPAVRKLEDWGFRVRIGDAVGKRDRSFGGTDAERLSDLQQAMDDPEVAAVFFARGGYGAVRIIDNLDLSKFLLKPKWVVGFSDMTVLHAHIQRHTAVATLHAKMCNSFPADWATADPDQVQSLELIAQSLGGKKMNYSLPVHPMNRQGTAEAVLVGGNMKTIEAMLSTGSDLPTSGRILFLEDTGEYPYAVDRMFRHLRRAGKLSGLAALAIGGFKLKPDDPGEEFGRTLEEIVMESVSGYDYPVCFGLPVGHQKKNFPLKCGVVHVLQVGTESVALTEK